ncbi:MAG: tRNA (adenosine(37)-N6)-threonylcarbamoyltransferase complex transferase subunit TsaD [Acidimicrobiales bacterium]|nr:tRNA (adenosine(37)-N6)-threonylcarbamoyltransferase complex transferase subunit TsaD [Acidimicrobiales bacterium]
MKTDTTVLAIETSCDETACAVIKYDSLMKRYFTLSSVVSSQIDIHAIYGGVVPEVASRAHVERIDGVIEAALSEPGISGDQGIDLVAATAGPGLIGALLVGVSAAKALAFAWDVPFIGINHLEGHLFASFLDESGPPEFPAVVLLASGGHTILLEIVGPGDYHLLGQTLDDAAGEAFDKVARYLGLSYPGGPEIDRLSKIGNPKSVPLPRVMTGHNLDLSFSGVKTAVIRYVDAHPEVTNADVAASFQDNAVLALTKRLFEGADRIGAKTVMIAGGVAANSLLRESVEKESKRRGLAYRIPNRKDCTDNAAMIGAAAIWRYLDLGPSDPFMGAKSNMKLSYR